MSGQRSLLLHIKIRTCCKVGRRWAPCTIMNAPHWGSFTFPSHLAGVTVMQKNRYDKNGCVTPRGALPFPPHVGFTQFLDGSRRCTWTSYKQPKGAAAGRWTFSLRPISSRSPVALTFHQNPSTFPCAALLYARLFFTRSYKRVSMWSKFCTLAYAFPIMWIYLRSEKRVYLTPRVVTFCKVSILQLVHQVHYA